MKISDNLKIPLQYGRHIFRMNAFLKRSLAILVIVAAWLAALCVFTAPSHACCQQARHVIQKTLPPCCTTDGSAQGKAQLSASGSDAPLLAAALPALRFDFLIPDQLKSQQSWLDLAFIPDQSKLFLELGVFLS